MSGRLSGGNVIFDYDRTLVPEESLLEVVRLSLQHRPDAAAALRTLQARAARLGAGQARPGDLLALTAGLFEVRRDAVLAYSQAAATAIRPFQPVFEGLRRDGARLFIVSAAFADWIVPVASRHGFQPGEIAANRFRWLGDRAVGPADWALALSGDKTPMVRRWRQTGILQGPAVMVGDSASDRAIFTRGLAEGFVAAACYADPECPGDAGARRAASVEDVGALASDLLATLLRAGRRRGGPSHRG